MGGGRWRSNFEAGRTRNTLCGEQKVNSACEDVFGRQDGRARLYSVDQRRTDTFLGYGHIPKCTRERHRKSPFLCVALPAQADRVYENVCGMSNPPFAHEATSATIIRPPRSAAFIRPRLTSATLRQPDDPALPTATHQPTCLFCVFCFCFFASSCLLTRMQQRILLWRRQK